MLKEKRYVILTIPVEMQNSFDATLNSFQIVLSFVTTRQGKEKGRNVEKKGSKVRYVIITDGNQKRSFS